MDPLPPRAELVIIGGGLAGLATAWAATERGARDVVVLERDSELAGHASARNAAMCRALAEDDGWTAWTALGARFLRHPPPDFSDHPLVDQRGAVLLADAPLVAELAARADRFGLRQAPITRAQVAARWPGIDAPRGGLHFPDDGCVDLAALIGGYLRGARRGGARFVVRAPALELNAHRAGVDVVTPRGVVCAEAVVIAAGAWAEQVGVLAGRALGFETRRRHVFALGAPASADATTPILWNVDGPEWYLRPAGHELWTSACDSDPTAPGEIDVRPGAEAEARRRVPGLLSSLPTLRAWACQRTFAPAGQPLVARDDELPWLTWVAGLGGHGVTASAAVGRAAATLLDHQR